MTSPRTHLWLPAVALWRREIIRFLRQRNRIIGALVTPLVFWLLIGSGIGPGFRLPGLPADMTYLAYFFPGTVVLILLFTAIFSTISVIEDRREGFLQGVLVAPVAPEAIVLGKFLGGMTLAAGQAFLFCLAAPLAGLPFDAAVLARLVPALLVVGFALVGLGFLLAWPLDSTQGFHAIMNVFLMPLWMLSGALFPAAADSWARYAVALNPVAYGTAAVRRAFYGDAVPLGLVPGYGTAMLVSAVFAATMFLLAVWLVRRKRSIA
ncbi:MAG: ABC transporter permease [Chthoniobacterales bacterium]|jgi:ABC-2 type transport system permease protein|nr:ABC transporter permease [Chthoniobacterales bacterium]